MNEDKDKRAYELALLLKSEDDLASVLTLLRGHSGELVSEPRVKKLALAYKIKGNTEAVFAYATFTAFGEDAKNLEHDLGTRQEVIRFMIILAPPQPERQPSLPPSFPPGRRGRPVVARSTSFSESKPAAPRPLSNEALEKKMEEILQ